MENDNFVKDRFEHLITLTKLTIAPTLIDNGSRLLIDVNLQISRKIALDYAYRLGIMDSDYHKNPSNADHFVSN